MLIYPAIELAGGESIAAASSHGANDDAPAPTAGELAAQMAGQGFAWLHVIDRDARDHRGAPNTSLITGVLDYMDLPLQLDAGVQDEAVIDDWLARGVSRLVLNPALTRDRDRLDRLAARHPGQLVAVLDVDDGQDNDTPDMLQDMSLGGVLVRESTSCYSDKARRLSEAAMRAGLHRIYDGAFPDFRAFCRMLGDQQHSFDGILTGGLYDKADFDAYTALRSVARDEALSR